MPKTYGGTRNGGTEAAGAGVRDEIVVEAAG